MERPAQPNVNGLVRVMLEEMMSTVATLQMKGYADLTFAELEKIMFAGVSGALKELGMTRRGAAILMGSNVRTFFDLLRRHGNAESGPSDRSRLHWDVLLYINRHRAGVSQAAVLEHFSENADEDAVLAILEALRRARLVFETGGRGSETMYCAPTADVPDGKDFGAIAPSLRAHMRAVGDAVVTSMEAVLFGRDSSDFVLTVESDFDRNDALLGELDEAVREFIVKLRRLFEEAEQKSGGAESQRVVVYMRQTTRNQ